MFDKVGVNFIVHRAGDHKDVYSRPYRVNISAEDCLRIIETQAPGLRGLLEIGQYVDGKYVRSYRPETAASRVRGQDDKEGTPGPGC